MNDSMTDFVLFRPVKSITIHGILGFLVQLLRCLLDAMCVCIINGHLAMMRRWGSRRMYILCRVLGYIGGRIYLRFLSFSS